MARSSVGCTPGISFFGFHHPEQIGARMKERLRAELNLTPEQVAKISPIIDKTALQLREIRQETARHVHETIAEAHRHMAANLTDEQRQKLQQIEERHRRWRHGRFRTNSPDESPVGQSVDAVKCAGRACRDFAAKCPLRDRDDYETASQTGLSASHFSCHDFTKQSRPAINESGVKLNQLCAGPEFLLRRFCVENSTRSDHRNCRFPN